MKPVDLIKYIVWYATQHDMVLTTVRLVKFIYLADLYHARTHPGETLTSFPWAFVYYGPYCGEAMNAIDNAVAVRAIHKKSYESRFDEEKDYNLFTCDDNRADAIERNLSIEILSPLKAAISKYGDDTAALLDHVYFETEPMMDAKKGDLLDFSASKPIQRSNSIEPKRLSREEIELAKRHINKFGKKLKSGRRKLHQEDIKVKKLMDEAYWRALEYMDGEDLKTGLKGLARIVR